MNLRGSLPVRAARDAGYRLLELSPRRWCDYHRRRDGARRHVVDAATDLCVEGYPASANSFVRQALVQGNPDLTIASHLHRAVHVQAALELGVPVLVLVREPEAAVTSVLLRSPAGRSVAGELARYERFHRQLLPVLDRVGVIRFEDATSRLGDALAAAARHLGVALPSFDHDDAAQVQRVTDRLDEVSHHVFGADAAIRGAAPSESRSAARHDIAPAFARPLARRRLDVGRRLHERFAGVAAERLAAATAGGTGP